MYGLVMDRCKGCRLVRAGLMGLAGLQLASLGISLMPKASLGTGHLECWVADRTVVEIGKANCKGYIVVGSRIQKNPVTLWQDTSGT